ncbi:sigma-70 family RNA polymerase sigma factor [Sinomonas atrocyanea]
MSESSIQTAAGPVRDRAQTEVVPYRPVSESAAGAAELATEYLGVADALARRFRCTGHDAEDLCQVARLGLLKAARRYRPDLGHGFVPYAVPTITGEIKRYLRDQSWVVRPPRGLQELRLKVRAVSARMTQTLGREPSTLEVARELGLEASDVAEAQLADAAMVGQPVVHTDLADDPQGFPEGVIPAVVDPGFERVEALNALARALRDASESERELLEMRFGEELTQEAIAQRLGVSQMQVSRLLRRILERLRTHMAA